MSDDAAPRIIEHLHEVSWARSADVLIVGSGAAACLAALATTRNGGTALLLEKSAEAGGNTGISNGTFWIPNNRLLCSIGRPDERSRTLAYMARVTWPDVFDVAEPFFGLSALAYRKLEAFFDNASPMLDVLVDEEGAFGVMFRQTWDGSPMPDTMARLPSEADQCGHGLSVDMRLSADGAFHPSGGGGGAQLIAGLRHVLSDRGVAPLLEHRVRRLVQLRDRTVVGLEADTPWGTRLFQARRAVVFASGGFTRSPELQRRFLNVPLAGARGGVRHNEGDFIAIGLASGVKMAGLDRVYGGLIAFETTVHAGSERGRDLRGMDDLQGIGAGDSMIQVNRHGRRVCSEKWMLDNHIEHHFRDPATGELPNRLTFQIYDQRTAELFGAQGPAPHIMCADDLSGLTRILRDRLLAVRDYTDHLTLADSFEAGLRQTIDTFNADARAGLDRQFGRGSGSVDVLNHLAPVWLNYRKSAAATGKTHAEQVSEFRARIVPSLGNSYPNLTMYPIADRGPYYAIMLGPNPVDTAGGPEVNEDGQVFAEDGTIIPRLYGAGSCVHGPSNGGYFGGGMAIGMAMTTGWLAGTRAMSESELRSDLA